MLVELTIRRAAGEPSPNSPVDGIRIMALLPARWRKDLKHVTGEIAIRVHTGEDETTAQIRAEVTAILTNPEVSDWELITCHTLANGRHEAKEDTR
ncbi:hypothetical protein [Sphaerisporangium corydalis]|uniref:Phosphoribosylformylglycinamidine synthase n=1 Tax=Sphaerisporangium corydalis TaxID=1441875 RepID=A0ABV9ECL4_9ACTN|nr:hypothetical protein [Sphaerisporangium corydalis]